MEPLWYDIRPHAHINTLQAQILSKIQILLVSNAAVHPNGRGTFAWSIWANTELWSGEGYAPGPPNDMYLGLAEAYGVFMALRFLQHYCQHFPELYQQQRNVNVYCDNQGVIDCSNRESVCPYPRDAISDDYPIYAEICQTITALKPIVIRMHHVKGHQDTKSDHPLMLPEKLNIECDARASKMEPTTDHDNQKIHPITEAAYPHLQIKEQIII